MRFGKYRLVEEKVIKELANIKRMWDERESIIKDNNIQKKKKKLEKKYKKYFGRYFMHEDGVIFEIRGIYYNSYGSFYYDKFQFDCYAPNHNDGFEVEIEDVIEGKYPKAKKGDIY